MYNKKTGGEKMSDENKNLTDKLTSVLEEIIEEPTEKAPKKGELAVMLNETELMIGNRQYKVVVDYREGFQVEKIGERFSEVLARYDYIVGDWGYEQLRLRGFFEVDNKKATPEQRIDTLEDYLYEYCNFGCAYFVIQRIGGKREKTSQRRRKTKQVTGQAHIEEKKEAVQKSRTKPKPKPKVKQKSQVRATKEKPEASGNKKESGKGFTIRKREDV